VDVELTELESPENGGIVDIFYKNLAYGAGGIAGNIFGRQPIEMARVEVDVLLNRLNPKQNPNNANIVDIDLDFGTMHEISHAFHHDRWNFHAEHFSNFQKVYVLDMMNELDSSVNYGMMAGYVFRNGAEIKDHYWYHYNRHLNPLAEDKGEYFHHDMITYLFLVIKDRIGWGPFRETFRDFLSMEEDGVPSSNVDKFNLFIKRLGWHYNESITSVENMLKYYIDDESSNAIPINNWAVLIDYFTPKTQSQAFTPFGAFIIGSDETDMNSDNDFSTWCSTCGWIHE